MNADMNKLKTHETSTNNSSEQKGDELQCLISSTPDLSHLTTVELSQEPAITDYRQAMKLANKIAAERIGEYMLLSWYDRDRDFESPQHSSECHMDSAVPGYVDYGLHHGATLKVNIEDGRFVLFYMPVDESIVT
jgi:Domain of unknown function (DUF5619)